MRPRCPVCGEDSTTDLWSLPTDWLREEWRKRYQIELGGELPRTGFVTLKKCTLCGLQFFQPMWTASPQLYSELGKVSWYYRQDKWEFQRAAKLIRSNESVCELGCGDGAFLEALGGGKGNTRLGLELSETAGQCARVRGLDVRNINVEEFAKYSSDLFDVVCAFQVLEHVSDPVNFIRNAMRLLKKGGRLLISAPNADSFLRWEVNPLDMPPHHVTRWTPKALMNFTARLGLEHARVFNEPLDPIHAESYARALLSRVAGTPIGSAVTHWRTLGMLIWILKQYFVRQFVTGHTIMISARKVS